MLKQDQVQNITKVKVYGLLNVILLFHVQLKTNYFLDDAKQLVANGVVAVAEGANMPTSIEATEYLQDNDVLFG